MSAETWAWGLATALFALAALTFKIGYLWVDWRTRALKAEARQLEAEDQRDRWKGWHDQRTDERNKLAAENEALRSLVIHPPMCSTAAECLKAVNDQHQTDVAEWEATQPASVADCKDLDLSVGRRLPGWRVA